MKKPLRTSTQYLSRFTRKPLLALIVMTAMFAIVTVTAFTQDPNTQPAPAQPAAQESRLELGKALKGVTGKEKDEPTSGEAPSGPEVASNYSFVTSTDASLTDMSSGTTQLLAANIDDTASALTNIGFDFYFQGARFSQFSINENGVLRLGAAAQASTPYKPLAQAGIPIITAYGADQRTHAGDGKVHFKVIGAAPNRTLVVEWLNNQANFNTGGTADLTYQVRLSETTGAIEFVYGSMTMSVAGAGSTDSRDPNIGFSSNSTAGTVGSVTAAQTGTPAPTFDGSSATPVANLYTAGTITVLSSTMDGSRRRFTFTPPTPTAPMTLTFTSVTAAAMTLNWTDAPDEMLYGIYRSTDGGTTYSFFNTAAQNATSLNATGLNPSFTYFWKVYSVSEGALSTALSGSQMTAPAGNITSTGAGGNWSATATWVGGVVPTASDNVTIVNGATVTIDVTTATCLNLTVGQGTSGVLQYITTPASTLTVNGDVTVAVGGTFTAGAGSLTTHVLNIGGSNSGSSAAGNLTVSGTFDMNTTAGATTNFFGTTDATVSGAGATCDFFAIVGQKGTTNAAILDVTRIITTSSPAASGSRLTVNGGTVKISSATTATPWFGSNTITGANGKLWINNASASLQCVGAGVSATGGGSPTFTGVLQIDAGTFGYGQGNNTMTVTGSLVMGGASATVNIFGAISFSANSSFTMTAGNINIDPQNVTNIAATTNLLRFNGPNTVSATGGTMTIVDPHAATGTGKALSISTSSGSYNFAGSTIRFGNGVSTTAGSVDGFDIDTFVGNSLIPVGNVVVDNLATNAATRFVRVNTALSPFQMVILGDLTITNSGGSRFNLNGNLVAFGKDVINNGTIDGTVASSRLYWTTNGVASTYSGTGTSVAPLVSWDVDNALGVTVDPAVSSVITSRIILFTGGITNTNKLTLGNGGATSGTVQIGNTTTPTAAGTLDVAPTFNIGTAGQIISYLRTTTSRTTGFEVAPARSLTTFTYDDNDVTHTLTIAGGDLTVTGTMALTNGRVITGANTLISGSAGTVTRTTGYVDGNFRKTFTAAASKTFEVGTANGYSPVTVNATAGTFPADFTVKAVQGPQPNLVVPALALQRYWTLTGTGITADLTFNYLDPLDVPGTANENNFVIFKYNGSFSTPGGTVNTAANTASITGVSSFSDWTLAEPNAEPCPISTTPTSQNFPGAGGSNSFTVTADGGCTWVPVSNNAFITIDSVNKPAGGHAGNGTVNYSVASNIGGPARMGTITIGALTFTVTQDTGCSFMLTPTSQNFSAPGGSNSVGVTATTGCGWTAVSNDAFIIVDSGTPGSGNGTVGYHVTTNTGPMRTGTMTIAGITFTVTQDAACAFNLSSLSQSFTNAGGSDSVNVTSGTGCTWTAVSNDAFITVNSGTPGSGNGTVGYTVAANVGPARMGTMTIAGITFTVNQADGCMFTLSRNHQSFPGNGGSGSVNVIASDSTCPWTASTSATYIHITSGTPGTGNGTLNYTVDANPGPGIRSDTITIAGQTYTVYQGIDFLDVPSNDLFYSDIGKLAARGVTLGCGSGNYCPNDSVLREQMAAFILRAKGEFSPPTPASQRFIDVPPANVFYNFIDRLAVLGITLGCNPPANTMYCPSSAVTREQMSAFLLRGLGEFTPPTPASQRFNDVPPANVFYNFIDRMAVLNITLGCTPDHLFYCPSDPVTRAQMAAFLVRAFDL